MRPRSAQQHDATVTAQQRGGRRLGWRGGPAALAVVLVMGVWRLGTAPAQAAPFAYITDNGSDTVSVIDTAINQVVATVLVGSAPLGVAVNPAGTRVYVTNNSSNTVSVIDTATNQVMATVPMGLNPFGVAVTPDGARVYVANGSLDTVSVIDTATNQVMATVLVGHNPLGVAVTPDGTRVYVANGLSDTVSVIDTATNQVVATVPVGSGPLGVAVNPAGTRVYVAVYSSNAVFVIDTANNQVMATVPVGLGPAAFGRFITPAALASFAVFTAKMEIELHPGKSDAFELNSNLTLGHDSQGIKPLTEGVKLELTGGTGSFTTTIPAGSFKRDKKGRFKFEGTIHGVELEAQITPLGGNAYEFNAAGEHADLTGIANPVTVKLTIGDDGGTTSVTAKLESDHDDRDKDDGHDGDGDNDHQDQE